MEPTEEQLQYLTRIASILGYVIRYGYRHHANFVELLMSDEKTVIDGFEDWTSFTNALKRRFADWAWDVGHYLDEIIEPSQNPEN